VIELTDEFRDRLSTAMMDGYPVVVASVDTEGYPHLSFYGTTQVLDHDHLALWARHLEGLPTRILDNPRVSLVYRNSAERVTWFFDGTARRDDDPAVRDRVFDASPELERAQDPDREGVAVVIELDRVRGRGFVWERDAPA
jgi:predicted pyridoxine 5'-phosphate oxidase superfamily flavin-nucleotide-binding protein